MEILKRIKKLLETESAVPANAIGSGAGVAVYDKLLKLRKKSNPTAIDTSRDSGPSNLPWNNVSNVFNNGNKITLQNPLHNLKKNDPSDTLVKRIQKSGQKTKILTGIGK